MKTTLYNIKHEYLDLMNQINDLDGEITPELEDQLFINEAQLQSKSVAYLEVIKSQESYTLLLDEEIKRLQALKKKGSNITDRLKNSLLGAVVLHGAFEIGFTKFGIRKSKSVSVNNVNLLPSEYKTVKVTEAAYKKAIKTALEAGTEIEGCSIEINNNLKIN